MKISIVCSDNMHPILASLNCWAVEQELKGHVVSIVNSHLNLMGGDLLFLVSCHQVVSREIRKKYRAALVLHASDLPRGRGWSPHIWSILNGDSEIILSLIEAADSVDSGAVWFKKRIEIQSHELFDEINTKLFQAELEIMSKAVSEFPNVRPVAQEEIPVDYLRKRTPDDSKIDPHQSIADQFNLLRVSDPNRYPAFFEFLGKKYYIEIKKSLDE